MTFTADGQTIINTTEQRLIAALVGQANDWRPNWQGIQPLTDRPLTEWITMLSARCTLTESQIVEICERWGVW